MTPITADEAVKNFSAVASFLKKTRNIKVVVCPPFVFLGRLSRKLNPKPYTLHPKLGAQDVFWENPPFGGSYTGEISVAMLKDLGVEYVIVGHSEERRDLHITDEMVNKKIKAVLKSGLKAILCVGEKKRDEDGDYLKFVKQEILLGLEGVSKKDLANLIIAYEPIWAISSFKNAEPDTPEKFLEMNIYIKKIIFSKYGRKAAEAVPVIYGGSVGAENVRGFLNEGRAHGVLVGRASFKPKTFIDLLKSIL